MLTVTAAREEKLAEEERDRLLSSSHINDDDEDTDIKRPHNHSKLPSADVASSIEDVHINDSQSSKAAGLFRRSSSANKSHRRVASKDSVSDEDCIGPSIPSTYGGHPEPSVHEDDDSDDGEIGPPAPAAATLQNIEQGTSEQHDSSDEEIGPPLPAAASESKQHDTKSQEETAAGDDDDDSDDDVDDEVTVYIMHLKCSF